MKENIDRMIQKRNDFIQSWVALQNLESFFNEDEWDAMCSVFSEMLTTNEHLKKVKEEWNSKK